MWGWFSAASVFASRSNRARRSASCANASGNTLIATWRPRLVSMARYTSPMPPAPMADRISYGPRRVPGPNDISGCDGSRLDCNGSAECVWLPTRTDDRLSISHRSEPSWYLRADDEAHVAAPLRSPNSTHALWPRAECSQCRTVCEDLSIDPHVGGIVRSPWPGIDTAFLADCGRRSAALQRNLPADCRS